MQLLLEWLVAKALCLLEKQQIATIVIRLIKYIKPELLIESKEKLERN